MKCLRFLFRSACPLAAALLLVLSAHAASRIGPPTPGNGADWLVIQKILAADCRAVRGFLGTPVDGTVASWDYRGVQREYPNTASDGVVYSYNRNDGLHFALADPAGFDAVVLRGGAKSKLYCAAGSLTEPSNIPPLHAFAGDEPVQVGWLARRIQGGEASLFGCEGGTVSDLSFYRIERRSQPPAKAESWHAGPVLTLTPPTSKFDAASLHRAMSERYGAPDRQALSLLPGKAAGKPLAIEKNHALHFITPPFEEERGLAGVALDCIVHSSSHPLEIMVAVQDPLDPRLDLTWFEWKLDPPGPLRLQLDIPDQVLLPNSRLWLTLRFSEDVALTGPDGGAPSFALQFVSPAEALPEALAWRKLLLRSFFSLLSEPRPWGAFRKQSREEFFASSRYAAQCPELFLAIDQCHALAPSDPLVRQYREWIYLKNLDRLEPAAAPPRPPPGTPDWAWHPRLAWLETRRIAQWWLDHRGVPTGEFGGRVGDDSDLYQQFMDLAFFESDGVAARLKDGAARMAELAQLENLRGGLNRSSTDALHAYEEGINHLALMSRWFYGDPIYLERCMESARNMERLTVVTPDGRRHFRNRDRMGARDIESPSPPAVDGQAAPMMWHTALQTADYNRNPQALRLVCEWADAWLRFMKPGQWATDIEVLSGKVLDSNPDRPLYGGYCSQATAFVWLGALTGDARYLEPLLHYGRLGQAPLPVNDYASELFSMGQLDGISTNHLSRLAASNPSLALYLAGDPKPLASAALGRPLPSEPSIQTIHDALRWPDMFTAAEPFTDRIFPHLLEHASKAFLGGYTRRNKFNPALAVSWEGFGTHYAALVTQHRRDRLRILAFNFSSAPISGRIRVWELDHGRYELTVGSDANADLEPDNTSRTEKLELAKADTVELTLPPRQATVVDLRQQMKLDPIWDRADLALAAREIRIDGNRVTGAVHNIGARAAQNVVVAIVDANGNVLDRDSLGALEAPLDLMPKQKAFSLPVGERRPGWHVVVDPDNQVPEIFEGNNKAPLPFSSRLTGSHQRGVHGVAALPFGFRLAR